MPSSACGNDLRNFILSVSPVHEGALTHLLDAFSSVSMPANSFLSESGDYPSHMIYLCQGLVYSFYSDTRGTEHVRQIFAPHEIVMPMPSFLYRKPAFLNFRAITSCQVLRIRYSVLEELMQKHSSVRDFVRVLIEKEWIVGKSLAEASVFIYNVRTRYDMIKTRLGEHFAQIPPAILASVLQISEKQLSRYHG